MSSTTSLRRPRKILIKTGLWCLALKIFFGDIQPVSRLFDFLNLKGFSSSHVSEVLIVKRNANHYGRSFPSVHHWSPDFERGIEQASKKHAVNYRYSRLVRRVLVRDQSTWLSM